MTTPYKFIVTIELVSGTRDEIVPRLRGSISDES